MNFFLAVRLVQHALMLVFWGSTLGHLTKAEPLTNQHNGTFFTVGHGERCISGCQLMSSWLIGVI